MVPPVWGFMLEMFAHTKKFPHEKTHKNSPVFRFNCPWIESNHADEIGHGTVFALGLEALSAIQFKS
jgi:hypothetical protein